MPWRWRQQTEQYSSDLLFFFFFLEGLKRIWETIVPRVMNNGMNIWSNMQAPWCWDIPFLTGILTFQHFLVLLYNTHKPFYMRLPFFKFYFTRYIPEDYIFFPNPYPDSDDDPVFFSVNLSSRLATDACIKIRTWTVFTCRALTLTAKYATPPSFHKTPCPG